MLPSLRGKQLALGLLGICHRRLVVNIPQISLHRRMLRGALNDPKTLGEHLRRKRVDMALGHVQVAEIMGVAYQTIQRWECNRRPITPNNQKKIIQFLGYDPRQKPSNPAPVSE